MLYGNYISLNLFNIMVMLINILIGVAFLTLLERKMLSYIQMRKGPNKVGLMGMLQPFSDAIKLMMKELLFIYKSVYFIYYLVPMFSMSLMFMCWWMIPFITNIYYLNYSILLVVVFLSMNSYMMMFMGWSSNSMYSMIGMIRSIAQVLSYEVIFIFIILLLMILSESFSFIEFFKYQKISWYMLIMFPVFLTFFISCLVELNRSPFDFIEGESELVSGFNVEYFSGGFTLIFLGEYGMIMFMSMFIMLLFLGGMDYIYMYLFLSGFCSLIIFMRGILPRLRYDELMYLCWKIYLPMVLNYMLYISLIKIMIILNIIL